MCIYMPQAWHASTPSSIRQALHSGQCHLLMIHIVSHKALFLFTPFKPSRITSRLKFTFHIIPCNTMLRHAKSSHVIPCHIMLSHVMSLRGSHFPTLPDQHLDLI